MLRAEGIEAGYGESLVLQGVSLHLPKGAAVGLLGRNGMGKTTLIRTVMGYLRARRGVLQ